MNKGKEYFTKYMNGIDCHYNDQLVAALCEELDSTMQRLKAAEQVIEDIKTSWESNEPYYTKYYYDINWKKWEKLKGDQKQHLKDIMKGDEDSGLYESKLKEDK